MYTNQFSDPEAVTRYAEGPPRLVPGFVDLQRMTSLLLAERAPNNARRIYRCAHALNRAALDRSNSSSNAVSSIPGTKIDISVQSNMVNPFAVFNSFL
jgi:hypothetical protein